MFVKGFIVVKRLKERVVKSFKEACGKELQGAHNAEDKHAGVSLL
jgi:hypothetical protein